MSKKSEGSGAAFTKQQKATDQAINERIKDQQQTKKIDPSAANNGKNRDRQKDTAHKKTGGGKQKNPGM